MEGEFRVVEVAGVIDCADSWLSDEFAADAFRLDNGLESGKICQLEVAYAWVVRMLEKEWLAVTAILVVEEAVLAGCVYGQS